MKKTEGGDDDDDDDNEQQINNQQQFLFVCLFVCFKKTKPFSSERFLQYCTCVQPLIIRFQCPSLPVSKIPTAIPTAQPNAHPVPACYPGMDITSCPVSCPSGQYCDGARCVPRSECPCSLDNKVIRVSTHSLHCGLIRVSL